MLCMAKQLRQPRAGPGRYDVEDFTPGVFDAAVSDIDLQLQLGRNFVQEIAFLGRRLVERHSNPIGHKGRKHKSRKTGAASQINQRGGCGRNESRELGAVPNVPPPDILKRRSRDHVVARIPVAQKLHICLESRQRFT